MTERRNLRSAKQINRTHFAKQRCVLLSVEIEPSGHRVEFEPEDGSRGIVQADGSYVDSGVAMAVLIGRR